MQGSSIAKYGAALFVGAAIALSATTIAGKGFSREQNAPQQHFFVNTIDTKPGDFEKLLNRKASEGFLRVSQIFEHNNQTWYILEKAR